MTSVEIKSEKCEEDDYVKEGYKIRMEEEEEEKEGEEEEEVEGRRWNESDVKNQTQGLVIRRVKEEEVDEKWYNLSQLGKSWI